MPKIGKGKGRKAGGSRRQLGTPGLSNAPPNHKTLKPDQRQLASPATTPRAAGKASTSFSQALGIEEEDKSVGSCRSDDEDEDEPSIGQRVRKNSPPGFLDSEDEELIYDWGEEGSRLMWNRSVVEWRRVGEELESIYWTR